MCVENEIVKFILRYLKGTTIFFTYFLSLDITEKYEEKMMN